MSRVKVQVELRTSTSISPEASAVKRVSPVVGMNSTLVGSPSTAAATARQIATSKPLPVALASGAAKPARPVLTPHFSVPRAFTSSSVAAEARAGGERQRGRGAEEAIVISFGSFPVGGARRSGASSAPYCSRAVTPAPVGTLAARAKVKSAGEAPDRSSAGMPVPRAVGLTA